MSRIEETEIRLSEIEQEMIEASADYAKIKDLTIEQQQLEQTYDEDITRWSELEELKRGIRECRNGSNIIALFWLSIFSTRSKRNYN